MIRVLGLDLSITATGVCLPGGRTYTIRGKAADGDRRLADIRYRLRADAEDADLAVIEDLPTHAHAAGITGMVHGAVRSLLLELEVPYVLVTPATLKAFATGKGNCDKAAMILAAYKRGGITFTDDNRCDAWWLWQAGLWQTGPSPDRVPLPEAQRARLDKANWSAAQAVTLAVKLRERAAQGF